MYFLVLNLPEYQNRGVMIPDLTPNALSMGLLQIIRGRPYGAGAMDNPSTVATVDVATGLGNIFIPLNYGTPSYDNTYQPIITYRVLDTIGLGLNALSGYPNIKI